MLVEPMIITDLLFSQFRINSEFRIHSPMPSFQVFFIQFGQDLGIYRLNWNMSFTLVGVLYSTIIVL